MFRQMCCRDLFLSGTGFWVVPYRVWDSLEFLVVPACVSFPPLFGIRSLPAAFAICDLWRVWSGGVHEVRQATVFGPYATPHSPSDVRSWTPLHAIGVDIGVRREVCRTLDPLSFIPPAYLPQRRRRVLEVPALSLSTGAVAVGSLGASASGLPFWSLWGFVLVCLLDTLMELDKPLALGPVVPHVLRPYRSIRVSAVLICTESTGSHSFGDRSWRRREHHATPECEIPLYSPREV